MRAILRRRGTYSLSLSLTLSISISLRQNARGGRPLQAGRPRASRAASPIIIRSDRYCGDPSSSSSSSSSSSQSQSAADGSRYCPNISVCSFAGMSFTMLYGEKSTADGVRCASGERGDAPLLISSSPMASGGGTTAAPASALWRALALNGELLEEFDPQDGAGPQTVVVRECAFRFTGYAASRLSPALDKIKPIRLDEELNVLLDDFD